MISKINKKLKKNNYYKNRNKKYNQIKIKK